jgi:TonB family protein
MHGNARTASGLLIFAIAALVLTRGAQAEPPLINVLYPPSGYVGPQEDPAKPHIPPEVSKRAQRCQESGTVRVTLTVAADGTVPKAVASVSTGYADLDALAVVQVRKWHFIPATKDGVPVAVRMVTTLNLVVDAGLPDFAADCSPAGAQAAAADIWRKSGLTP